MAISGQWKSSAGYIGYLPDRTGTSKNWGVGVDPDHDARTPGPEGFPPPAPVHRLEGPPFIEDMFNPARTPPAMPDADTETGDYGGSRPVYETLAQHEGPALPWGVPDNDRLRELSGRLHSVQRRRIPGQMATKVDRSFDETYDSERLQSLPQTPMGIGGTLTGQALRALRGRNSLAVNNPGTEDGPDTGNYVRRGWDLSRWNLRTMRRRTIMHTKRELHVNVAATGTAEAPGMPGPYVSPFGAWGRLRVGTATPGVRREPRPWDEDVADDFSAGEAAQFFGGF